MMKFHASQVYTVMGFWTSLANTTMFTTYAVYQVIAVGLNPVQLMLVGTVLEVTVLLFEGIAGVIADTYSRRLSVLIGTFVLGFGFLLEGSVIWLAQAVPILSAFLWLLLSQVIFGVGHTFISGADAAWVVDEAGEENTGRIFLKAKRAGLLGTLIGIAVSVWLSFLEPNLPYIGGGMLYLLLGIFLLIYMKETQFVSVQQQDEAVSHWANLKATWVSGTRVIRRQPVLLMVLLVTLFSGAASEGYDRLWQAHLITDIGFPQSPPFWIGLIAVVSTLASLLVMRAAERRIDLNNERIVLRGMILLTVLRIAAILALALSQSFAWALAAVLLFEIVRTLTSPVYDTWLNLNVDGRSRATVLSMMSQSDALGQTAGEPCVGWIGQRFSIRASLVAAAVLLVPVLAVYNRVRTKHQR
ncbi:MFS transporter [Paenibacillus sp. TAB 01]|uniref:MFS transporter n=1 Tax=Paenibacillus sp. TAB 01 TaxID=3368988 RepID=UPI0037505C11